MVKVWGAQNIRLMGVRAVLKRDSPRPRPKRSRGSYSDFLSVCVKQGPAVKSRLLQWIWAVCRESLPAPPPEAPPTPARLPFPGRPTPSPPACSFPHPFASPFPLLLLPLFRHSCCFKVFLLLALAESRSRQCAARLRSSTQSTSPFVFIS